MSTEEIGIKIGSKVANTGLPPTVIHTGMMHQEPVIHMSKIGMEEMITEKKDTINKIEIDSLKMGKLIDRCAEDLMVERIIQVPNSINSSGKDTVKFVLTYDSRNKIFSFSKDVKYLNTVLNLKNNDLADFLSGFFYSNISKYSEIVFNGVPIIMPATSMEALLNNRVQVTIH